MVRRHLALSCSVEITFIIIVFPLSKKKKRTACTFCAGVYVHVYILLHRWDNLRRLYFKELVWIIRLLAHFSSEDRRRHSAPLLSPVLHPVSSWREGNIGHLLYSSVKQDLSITCSQTKNENMNYEWKINSRLIGWQQVKKEREAWPSGKWFHLLSFCMF